MFTISFSRNFGKEAGLLAGLEAAQGDYVTVMDVEIFRIHLNFLSKCMPKSKKVTTLSGQDVQTVRVSRLFVHFFAKAFYWLINKVLILKWWMGHVIPHDDSSSLVDAILELKEVNRFSKGLFSWVGFDVAYVS